jgi:hypothetical protein
MRTTGNGLNTRVSGTVGCVTGLAAGGGATVGTETSNADGGAGAGEGVGVGEGAGVGIGEGDGGGAVASAVAFERASSEPSLFLTVSRTRSAEPMSATATRYRSDVAPSIAEQRPAARAHRNHVHEATGAGSPVHVATAVSSTPT